ncbi:MAG: pilus assembly protein PilM [Candidatus Paceibacterota bacterium]
MKISIDFGKLKKIIKVLNPMPEIGGIEISDSAIKFALAKEGKSVFVSLNLAPGIVSEGKVLDKAKLKEALKGLHSKITSKLKKQVYTVINIPDENIYTQSFNLPTAASDNIEEAAKLNLQMISPMDFSTAYSDWQKIGEVKSDGGQFEILGAFVSGVIVDDIIECLKEANFVVVAVEYAGLALSRVAAAALPQNSDFVMMHLGASGLNFVFVKNNNFYFNHFAAWPKGEERQIKMSVVEEMVALETQKTLNFVSSHWPETQIKNIFFSSPFLDDKIIKIISEKFNLPAQKVVLPASLKDPAGQWSVGDKQLVSLGSDWFSVLGSALRGLIPRSKDIIISLASAGTEEEFRQYTIINFSKMWRNALLTSLSLILVSFVSVDVFIMNTVKSIDSQLANLANLSVSQEIIDLQAQAKDFNSRIDLALKAKGGTYNFSPMIEKIIGFAKEKKVSIDRIFIQSKNSDILVNGHADDYQNIIDFKTKMENDPQFKDINMPLSSVVINSDGKSSFGITFKIK